MDGLRVTLYLFVLLSLLHIHSKELGLLNTGMYEVLILGGGGGKKLCKLCILDLKMAHLALKIKKKPLVGNDIM